ncbi:MAG TPA: DUF924 family protein [Burkholderiales bacterium]|nr:DUF924 family protein [Burkholderiales bacterium]
MSRPPTNDPRAQAVLDFWFRGEEPRKEWFQKDPAFDAEIARRFLALHEVAAAGELADWRHSPGDCLALIILLDQFPRNMFRGTAKAFSTDAMALDAAKHAVDTGLDRSMSDVQRTFVYLPFEHSESLADQERALELFAGNPNFEWARKHWEIVRRFGRFPHRNAILGRESTAAEIEFLKEPGSGF